MALEAATTAAYSAVFCTDSSMLLLRVGKGGQVGALARARGLRRAGGPETHWPLQKKMSPTTKSASTTAGAPEVDVKVAVVGTAEVGMGGAAMENRPVASAGGEVSGARPAKVSVTVAPGASRPHTAKLLLAGHTMEEAMWEGRRMAALATEAVRRKVKDRMFTCAS